LSDDIQEVRKCYGRLKAFLPTIPERNIHATFLNDFQIIVARLAKALNEDLSDFSSSNIKIWHNGSEQWCSGEQLRSRVAQTIGMLEYGYNVADQVVEIGSLYNSIRDTELRDRCGDLLTASSNFDRVINQATLILEDRLRKKAGLDRRLYGAGLASAAINSDPQNSRLVLSDTPSEQEGYANIVRGIMQALRNETHHTISEDFSRQDAFAVCGFIDRILRLIDKATVRS
jgi:hypothetical protein